MNNISSTKLSKNTLMLINAGDYISNPESTQTSQQVRQGTATSGNPKKNPSLSTGAL